MDAARSTQSHELASQMENGEPLAPGTPGNEKQTLRSPTVNTSSGNTFASSGTLGTIRTRACIRPLASREEQAEPNVDLNRAKTWASSVGSAVLPTRSRGKPNIIVPRRTFSSFRYTDARQASVPSDPILQFPMSKLWLQWRIALRATPVSDATSAAMIPLPCSEDMTSCIRASCCVVRTACVALRRSFRISIVPIRATKSSDVARRTRSARPQPRRDGHALRSLSSLRTN